MEPTTKEKKVSSQNQHLDNFLHPKLDPFLYKHQNRLFYISLFIIILFGILLFDVKISEGNDDSMYLLDAKKFMEGKSFPSFHGVFYTLLIGWIMKLIGFHLIFFKSLSLVFLIGHHIFFYLTLKHRISPFLLISTLIIISLNNSIIYFSSHTYTETLYMFLQSVFFYILLHHYINFPNNFKHITSNWVKYILMGCILFMLSATRNVGIGAIIAITIYLLIEKRPIPLAYTLFSFGLFKIFYTLYKKMAWGATGSDLASQIAISMQKNPYNKALGNEDFAGMFIRFIENIKTYLSNSLLNIMHFRNENYEDTNLFISLLIISILIVGFILTLRKSKEILLPIYLYLGISLGITFISLSQMWEQTRLIIVFAPFLIIGLIWPFSYLSKLKSIPFIRIVPILFVVFVVGKEFMVTSKYAKENKKVLARNLAGNKYYGYTPDIVNYLKLSEWASKNINDDVMIGCRKASMSFIYGNGREFYPIFRLPTENADSIINQAASVDHIIYFIDEDQLFKFQLRYILPIKPFLYATIVFNTSIYGLYKIPNGQLELFNNTLNQIGFTHVLSVEEFSNQIINKEKEVSASIPDKLINELKINNVHYLISAELRYNVTAKTEFTINTVERFMTIISAKYPGILVKVKQIGKNNDEPATLYKVNYEKYNL